MGQAIIDSMGITSFQQDIPQILKVAKIGLWKLLLGDGIPKLYIDDRIAKLLSVPANLSPEDIYEKFKKGIAPQDWAKFLLYKKDLLDGKPAELEYRHGTPSGEVMAVRCGGVIDTDYKGPGNLICGYLQDVTPVKRVLHETQQQLEEEHRKLQDAQLVSSVLTHEFANVYLVNTYNKTIEVRKQDGFEVENVENGDYLRLGYDDAWAYYIESCVHPDDREALFRAGQLENIIKELETKDEYTYNYRSIQHGLRHFQSVYHRLDEDRIIVGFRNVDAIVMQEQRQRQIIEDALLQAESANKAKTAFLNSMSHDIRTPLNAIMGFTRMAAVNLDDREKITRCLDKIEISSEHLLALINDVLEMSRIESGKVQIELGTVSLRKIINGLQCMFEEQAGKKKQILIFDTDNLEDSSVLADELRLNQVLFNCVSNAIKYTPEGGTITVKVSQSAGSRAGYGLYTFTVRDTGIGMSPEFMKSIFKAFSREQASTVNSVQGTGLGMAIAKNLVNLMDGTITVSSEKNKGSEFVVSLELEINDYKKNELDVSPESITKMIECDMNPDVKSPLEGLSILLVEDNELNREIAEVLLSSLGAKVELAEDGDVAVERIKQEPTCVYDVILMDIQMPKLNGYEATAAIRKLTDPQKAGVPIIAMSANAFLEDKKAALAAGMNDHVAKPIDVKALVAAIQNIRKGRNNS
ncbi:MAG: ATP-binding protein [Selenomonadaceae bacterium]|nr:ATP-binding protein [Selenomonadaceae bacterium]